MFSTSTTSSSYLSLRILQSFAFVFYLMAFHLNMLTDINLFSLLFYQDIFIYFLVAIFHKDAMDFTLKRVFFLLSTFFQMLQFFYLKEKFLFNIFHNQYLLLMDYLIISVEHIPNSFHLYPFFLILWALLLCRIPHSVHFPFISPILINEFYFIFKKQY